MEVQLQELIDKIKSEGIANAKLEADRIVAEAEAKAKNIITEAQAKASSAMENVKKEELLADQRGREAMVNAGRDLILNLNTRITQLFDAAMVKSVNEAMSGDALTSLIKNVLTTMDSSKGYEIAINEAEAGKIGDALKGSLSAMAKGGIEIKPTKMIDAGFRISEKDGSVFYDFSSQIIADNLSGYVNPKLAEDLKKAAGVN